MCASMQTALHSREVSPNTEACWISAHAICHPSSHGQTAGLLDHASVHMRAAGSGALYNLASSIGWVELGSILAHALLLGTDIGHMPAD